MNCYFDGSVGGRSDEWLAIGGFVATDATWAKVQRDWPVMLRSRNPVAPYVHMAGLLTGNGPFKRDLGWTEEKLERLVWDAAGVLASMDQTKISGLACAVDLHAHKRLISEGYQATKPAVICAELGLGSLLNWYTQKHKLELAHLFYDRNEPFIRSIRTRWLRQEEKKTKVKHPFWGSIAEIQELEMRATPAIQGADILAWSFVRRLRDDQGDEWSTLATKLIGSRNTRGALTATQFEITEEIMRQKYPKRNRSTNETTQD